jgi:hypothetical protein
MVVDSKSLLSFLCMKKEKKGKRQEKAVDNQYSKIIPTGKTVGMISIVFVCTGGNAHFLFKDPAEI